MKSIIILIDYFGEWPPWFPIYLESCKRNASITWLFHTDCPFDSFDIKNVTFRAITKADYIKRVKVKLGVNLNLNDNYKLCDLKPMRGVLHEEEIQGYDFFGYGDIDVIYGDIRKFYTDSVLKNNVISAHNWCVSGHFALIKNVKWLRNAFRRIKNWQTIVSNPDYQRFDEDIYTKVFLYPENWRGLHPLLYDLLNPFTIKYRRNLYFFEQFTTPHTPYPWWNGSSIHPMVWYWSNGNVTNEFDGTKEFLYFHFMNYKIPRYMHPIYGSKPLWGRLADIIHLSIEDMETGVRIDQHGFHKISNG